MDDGGEYFLGRSKRAGGAIVSPELLRYVAERASRDSAILKETRKASEEKALARKHEKWLTSETKKKGGRGAQQRADKERAKIEAYSDIVVALIQKLNALAD
eukprot:3774992-Amphidinium_carterae.1